MSGFGMVFGAGSGKSALRAGLGRGGPVRYAAAGMVNTSVGYAFILVASACGLPPLPANTVGFAAGLATSWVLARGFTFAPPQRPGAVRRYLTAFLGAFGLNLVVTATGLRLGLAEPLAHAFGIAAYAAAFYAACRWWVFGALGSPADRPPCPRRSFGPGRRRPASPRP